MQENLILDGIIRNALEEDLPWGDVTTIHTISSDSMSKAAFEAKEPGIACGLKTAEMVFKIVDSSIVFAQIAKEGKKVEKGEILAKVEGPTRSLLAAERTALNLLQRMSGIATYTRAFCDKVRGTKARIVDTRKTAPGLRYIDKYSVCCGGGTNHRYCLSDGVLIKDNHIKAAGGIKNALRAVKGKIPHTAKIEIEVSDFEQLEEALEEGTDIIMLDNMSLEDMKKAVKMIGPKALVEASGNVSLDNVRDVAMTGVDLISVGSLTHSVKALDISMKIE